MMGVLRVVLVTTWGEACGISEHSRQLKEAVEAADPEIQITPNATWLDPAIAIGEWDHAGDVDLVHLNYQDALHSRWTPGTIKKLGYPTLVTYHDSGVPNSDNCKAIVDAASHTILHEPFEDLPPEKATYLRMGVPDCEIGDWRYPNTFTNRPILGTVGFPFQWKCYDELARITAEVGWNFVLIAPNATDDQVTRWKELNPRILVEPRFIKGPEVLARLAACDATAFTYVTHNTGQSGAILQGIAVRKPMIALHTCRQFRALLTNDLAKRAIHWAADFAQVRRYLIQMPLERLSAPITALAEQESWTRRGKDYSAIYRRLL